MSVSFDRALLRGFGLVALIALATPWAPARAADPAPAAATAQTTTEPAAPPEQPVTLNPLVAEKLANAPGNTFTAIQVTLAPGAAMPSHHHGGFVYAYVLSGKIRSQMEGGKATVYKAGQSWTEAPGARHVMFQNASRKKRAKLLAIFVAKDGAELTTIDK